MSRTDATAVLRPAIGEVRTARRLRPASAVCAAVALALLLASAAAAQSADSPARKELYAAAKAAGLQPVLEDEHPHPSRWFERAGRVLVPESAAKSKDDVILAVGQRLRALVQARGPGGPKHREHRERERGGKKKRRHRRHK